MKITTFRLLTLYEDGSVEWTDGHGVLRRAVDIMHLPREFRVQMVHKIAAGEGIERYGDSSAMCYDCLEELRY